MLINWDENWDDQGFQVHIKDTSHRHAKRLDLYHYALSTCTVRIDGAVVL